MSYSGESDTESADETNLQQFKCHMCQYKPNFDVLVYILSKILEDRPFLVRLPNGEYFVRCQFDDCERYYHLKCIHPTYPDNDLNQSDLPELQQNGIHCPLCEPGYEPVNY